MVAWTGIVAQVGWGEDGDWWSWCTTVLFGTKSEARRVGGRAMLATETESA